jgi:heptosyltransferase III
MEVQRYRQVYLLNLDRILVFRAGHLGDNLVALPAFWALREAFPRAEITYLSNADDENNPHYVTARGIFPETGLFDDWISYPNLDGVAGIARALRLVMTLRRKKFDAVVYMTTRTRTERQIARDVRFFRLAGIGKIFGAENMKLNSLSEAIKGPMQQVEAEGDYLVRLVREEGLADLTKEFAPDLKLTSAEYDAAARWMKSELQSDSERRLIGVAPGSKWESKIWSQDRFADVVGRLIESHNVLPVIFGGAEDREKGDRLIAVWQVGINAAGKLNVRQAAAALESCELYLGNDTGTMHLAASVATPCVAIFSALDLLGRWYPYGASNQIFRRSVECEGCYSPTCFNNAKCLDLITADEVYAACVRILDKPSHG